MKSLPKYMDDKIIPVTECGCWIWMGALDKGGYGKSTYRSSGLRRHVRAHRIVYEVLVGEIPGGKLLMHRCDNPCCVNPDHMIVGTQAENVADRKRKGRSSQGDAHYRACLTSEQVLAIRAAEGRPIDIARKFGISRTQVWRVQHRHTWKHL